MIYDCFIFCNELDLLELRLEELNDCVDKFVLVESDTTFSGASKELVFQNNRERFQPWLHKIEHVVVNDMPGGSNAWTREAFQRNAKMRGLSAAKPNDLILLSDLDEIPNVPAIERAVEDGRILALKQRLYYYYFNLRLGDWQKPSACLFKDIQVNPQKTRAARDRKKVRNAGWHFSYLMSPEQISQKIQNFSHQELNKPEFVSVDRISDRMRNLADPFDRKGFVMTPEPLDNRFPKALIRNQEKFRDYILPVGPASA